MKFISGLVVGFLCGTFLPAIKPMDPNLLDRNTEHETANLPIAEQVWTRDMTDGERHERFDRGKVEALDKITQEKWEKITSDPVWEKLSQNNKMEIWEAFEKTYVSKTRERDDKVQEGGHKTNTCL